MIDSARTTLVLVHGAWHGAWCWERLTPHLERRGLAARTLDLPSVHGDSPARPREGQADGHGGGHAEARAERGLVADAAAVRALVDSVPGRIAICGHSYGGMAISLAAAGHERVSRLIFLAAFMPEEGQSLVDMRGRRHASFVQMLEGGLTRPDPARAPEMFYGDCDAATRAWALAQLLPQQALAFVQPVPHPAWREIPSAYIVCKRDRTISPQWQRERFVPRARRSIELDSGHSSFLSQPEALAEALADLV